MMNLPDEFEYINASGLKYKATKNAQGYFIITDEFDNEVYSFPSESLIYWIERCCWKIVKPSKQPLVRTKEWVEQHTLINVNSVFNAAKFIVENNPYCKDSVQELVDEIHDKMDILLDNAVQVWEYSYTSTLGYTISFMPDDEENATVEVTVDPGIGRNAYYVNVKDYFEQVV